MYGKHLETAYWAVLQELTIGDAIPTEALQAAWPAYERAWNDKRLAGAVLHSALHSANWDWPAWYSFAKTVKGMTLERERARWAKMTPSGVLHCLSDSALAELCTANDVGVTADALRFKLVGAVVRKIGKAEIEAAIAGFRLSTLREHESLVRRKMTPFLVSRMASVAHAAFRRDQMRDPEFLSAMPIVKFRWGGDGLKWHPVTCRRFDGRCLPHAKAQTSFPALPCESLMCRCELFAHG